MKSYKEFTKELDEAVLPFDKEKFRASLAAKLQKQKEKEAAAPKPKTIFPVEKSKEELKQEHDKLSKQLDPHYRMSDDYTHVKNQEDLHRKVAALKSQI